MNVCPGDTSTLARLSLPAIFTNRLLLEKCENVYQNADGTHHVREVLPGVPLTVVNWRYPECAGGTFNSFDRVCRLNNHFRTHHPSSASVATAMRLPLVNSWITLHRLLFEPVASRVQLTRNNSFAASGSMHALSMTSVFE